MTFFSRQKSTPCISSHTLHVCVKIVRISQRKKNPSLTQVAFLWCFSFWLSQFLVEKKTTKTSYTCTNTFSASDKWPKTHFFSLSDSLIYIQMVNSSEKFEICGHVHVAYKVLMHVLRLPCWFFFFSSTLSSLSSRIKAISAAMWHSPDELVHD